MTTEHSFILAGGPMTSRELTYVQASRARGEMGGAWLPSVGSRLREPWAFWNAPRRKG
ncbi:MAG: hypothetical protein L0Z50_30445 [Verrucomicrobiales bacterium]|nr:hypothetical protein [Verrucomicrobiales bacterium]